VKRSRLISGPAEGSATGGRSQAARRQRSIARWAEHHLEDSRAHDPRSIYESLLTLSAWGASKVGASDEECRQSLGRAFDELEAMPGFTVFRRRRLDDSDKRPSHTELAAELGVSRSRPGQMEVSFERSRGAAPPRRPLEVAALADEDGAPPRPAPSPDRPP